MVVGVRLYVVCECKCLVGRQGELIGVNILFNQI